MHPQYADCFDPGAIDNVREITATGIPLGRWVRLTFMRDGFDKMYLFINDALVQRRATSRNAHFNPC
jgi:hypothetical protein